MAKTDWSLNDTVQPQDMNDIGEEINQLRNDIDNIDVPPASLTKAGIVQLNDAVNDTSITTAATANAVKKAYDRADQAFQFGNERKQEVVDVLVAKGISASTSESWDSLIAKMAGIIKATGNATAAHLLEGYTASNASGPITGGMINRTAEAHHQPAADTAVFPGDRVFLAPPQGYFSGDSWVFAPAPQLSPDNLPKDVNILGIIGTLERMTTAEKQAIVNAITAKGIPASINDSNTALAQKIGQIEKRQYFTQTYPTFEPGSDGVIDVTVPFTPKIISVHAQSAISGRGNYYSIMAASVSIIDNPNIKISIASLTFNLDGVPTGSNAPYQLRDSSNTVITSLMPLSSYFKIYSSSTRTIYNLVVEAWA